MPEPIRSRSEEFVRDYLECCRRCLTNGAEPHWAFWHGLAAQIVKGLDDDA
jgi:hypothetical protein